MATVGTDIECRSNSSREEEDGDGDEIRWINLGGSIIYIQNYVQLISLIPSVVTDEKKKKRERDWFSILF